MQINRTGAPCFIACHFMAFRIEFFYKLKVCGESISTIFPIAFAHFMALCHLWVILAIFQTFSLLLYLLWWTVISDFWCYYCNCFGKPHTALTSGSKFNQLLKWQQWIWDITLTQLVKQRQGLRRLTPILKGVLLWVKCYQTALHATEKLFGNKESIYVAKVLVVLF